MNALEANTRGKGQRALARLSIATTSTLCDMFIVHGNKDVVVSPINALKDGAGFLTRPNSKTPVSDN
jgi:hypothetical protein